MAQRRRFITRSVATLIALCLLAMPALGVAAQGIYTGTSSGYDISFPQCGYAYPTLNAYTFGMVGITSGHAFRNNPCFASEYAWATHTASPESVYLNLNEDIGVTALYGDTGPYGTCGPDDPCHALNYGYNAASSAYTYAAQQANTFATRMWWLDIETLNSWSETDLSRNQAVIKGALQFLLVEHGFMVGIYSTTPMWQEITGGWQIGLPAWVGGGYKDDAKRLCDASFTGGAVYLVQYDDDGYDGNYTC
ncbi:MAG: hypothetical protein M3008_08435 [Chloroflexota bacterium]|nr:hypothetical protein [Chloroflexota bacterium]